jgi:hypothetical protein
MPQIKSNFTLKSKSPNFERDTFNNRAEMREVNPGHMDDGHISYCKADGVYYVFNPTGERYITAAAPSGEPNEDNVGYFKPLLDVLNAMPRTEFESNISTINSIINTLSNQIGQLTLKLNNIENFLNINTSTPK